MSERVSERANRMGRRMGENPTNARTRSWGSPSSSVTALVLVSPSLLRSIVTARSASTPKPRYPLGSASSAWAIRPRSRCSGDVWWWVLGGAGSEREREREREGERESEPERETTRVVSPPEASASELRARSAPDHPERFRQ